MNSMQHNLARDERLKKRADFQRVFQDGKVLKHRLMLLRFVRNDLEHSRFAPAVGKRLGNAVKRNRLKRLLREAYRLQKQDFPLGYDLVAIPLRWDPKLKRQDFDTALSDLRAQLTEIAE